MLVGIEIVRKALRIPCLTIAENAGVDAQEVVTRVMQEQPDIGYDALHGTYVDMMKAGIIDPTKVGFTFLLINSHVIGGHSAYRQQLRRLFLAPRHCVQLSSQLLACSVYVSTV